MKKTSFEFEVDASGLKVDIGMPVGFPYIPFPTAVSLIETTKFCTQHRVPVRQISPVGCSLVTDARSAVVDEFLKGDSSHLFWVDADMAWRTLDFLRLMSFCTRPGVDVVGATYTPKSEPARFMVRNISKVPGPYGLIEVSGLGLGFTIMRREVVRKIADSKPWVISNGATTRMRDVFRLDKVASDHRLGEDMAFFQDIRDAGYKVWMDPEVDLSHVGLKLYGGSVMDAVRKAMPDAFESELQDLPPGAKFVQST